MFWKKKEEEYTLYTTHNEAIKMLCELLGFGFSTEKGEVVEQNNNVGINLINKKLDLILSHLNLEYVAETEKREPAKLVEKKNVIECNVYPAIHGVLAGFPDLTTWTKKEQKKKKRGRPKKK